DPHLLPVESLVELLTYLGEGLINQPTAKMILAEMFGSGKRAKTLIIEKGLEQVSDEAQIIGWISQVLQENPEQVQTYLNGKEALEQWFFGQVMRLAAGKANPKVVQQALRGQLLKLKEQC
ncbi:MAG: Asp-tRNA(Asn)/Glu-tRNA(Gln) amidotransferase GatCAB subunit B, partial [Anaerolineales bacterium]